MKSLAQLLQIFIITLWHREEKESWECYFNSMIQSIKKILWGQMVWDKAHHMLWSHTCDKKFSGKQILQSAAKNLLLFSQWWELWCHCQIIKSLAQLLQIFIITLWDSWNKRLSDTREEKESWECYFNSMIQSMKKILRGANAMGQNPVTCYMKPHLWQKNQLKADIAKCGQK